MRGFQWNVQFQSPCWRITQRFLIRPPRPRKYAADAADDDGYDDEFNDDDGDNDEFDDDDTDMVGHTWYLPFFYSKAF